MSGKTLSYYEKNKDRVDEAHANLFSPVSMDMVIFDAVLDKPMDVSLIFNTLERKRQQRVIERMTPEGDPVSYRLMTIAVGPNKIVGFKKDALQKRVAYIVYDENGKVKSDRPAEHKGKKGINIGIEGELIYKDATYSVSLWVWNKGSIHVTMGIRKGSPYKKLNKPSELIEIEKVFYNTMRDLMIVLWDHALGSGNPQLRMPGRSAWRISNNSFTAALLRSWSVPHAETSRFKLETSLLLDYHILDQPYEGGYIRVGRHGREDSDDTYFMLYVTFVSFDILFKKIAQNEKDGDRYRLNGIQINPECWTVEKGKRSEKDTLDYLSNKNIIKATMTIGDSKLRITEEVKGSKGSTVEKTYILNANLAVLPHVILKVYKSGKIQGNGYKGMPLLTAWRGIDCLITALTKKGIPKELQNMMKDKADAFSWLSDMVDKSVVDTSADVLLLSPGHEVGVRVKLGRRGRKPKVQNAAANNQAKDVDVHIDLNNGKLVIDKVNSNHKTALLEAAARKLGIPLSYEDKRKTYPKSRKEITRDVLMDIMIRDGIPKYAVGSKDKAITNTLTLVQGQVTAGMTYDQKAELLQQLLDKEIATRTITNKPLAAQVVKSPEYRDDVYSPPDRRRLRRLEHIKNSKVTKKSSENVSKNADNKALTPVRKQYLVLDAIFGYPSWDI